MVTSRGPLWGITVTRPGLSLHCSFTSTLGGKGWFLVRGDGRISKGIALLYDYQVIATNLKRSPYEVWNFYNKRANVEHIIKEGIYSFLEAIRKRLLLIPEKLVKSGR